MRYQTNLVSAEGESRKVDNLPSDLDLTVEMLLRGSVRVVVEYPDKSMLVYERKEQ